MDFNHKEKYTGILLAAGSGKRFSRDKPKQFWEIETGITVLEKSFNVIAQVVKKIIVALPKETDLKDLKIKKQLNDLAEQNKVSLVLVSGGSTRQESVLNCLEYIDSDFLLIHDSARPFLSIEDVKNLLERALCCKAAILAKPLTSTIKLCKRSSNLQEKTVKTIERTIDRSTLWSAETPQAFETNLFKKAVEHAKKNNFEGTDDSSIMENYGYSVEIVESKFKNEKITFQRDLN
ncbi:MAG: 2-C-methyl-D-erythritol 4-phosphate cytidylyltransferase [Candidatus Caenarcaniphilales bacterium]|nr:2-C-methyl-D-erythritol 4-phosphate cytidylyltransferase [Candidatus Caenarcaniphilales bacterium]